MPKIDWYTITVQKWQKCPKPKKHQHTRNTTGSQTNTFMPKVYFIYLSEVTSRECTNQKCFSIDKISILLELYSLKKIEKNLTNSTIANIWSLIPFHCQKSERDSEVFFFYINKICINKPSKLQITYSPVLQIIYTTHSLTTALCCTEYQQRLQKSMTPCFQI